MNRIFTWRRSAVSALLTLAMAAAACGGPDGESIPPTATGIPDAAPASALSSAAPAAEERSEQETVSLQPVSPSTTWLTTTAAVTTTAVTAPESPAADETTTTAEAPATSHAATTVAETTTTAPAPTTAATATTTTEAPAATTTTATTTTATTAPAPTSARPTTTAPAPTTTQTATTTTQAPTATTTTAAPTPTTVVADGRPVISIPRPGDDVPVRNDFGRRVDPAVFPPVANVIPYERWNSEDFDSMPEWAFLNVDPDRPSRTVSGLVPGAWSKPMDLRIGTAVYGAQELIPRYPTPPGVLEVFVVTGIYLDPLDSDHYRRNAEVYQIRVCGVTPETISWGIEWGRQAIVNEDGLYQLMASDPYGEDGTCDGKL